MFHLGCRLCYTHDLHLCCSSISHGILSFFCIYFINDSTLHIMQPLNMWLKEVRTHRQLGLDHVLHLNVQVLYFYLHAFSGFHCCAACEL